MELQQWRENCRTCAGTEHTEIRLCSSTKLAWEANGSRSSRRVDDVKMKRDLMGCQICAVVVTMASMV